jgi:polyisoprenoid-binding protein YceI
MHKYTITIFCLCAILFTSCSPKDQTSQLSTSEPEDDSIVYVETTKIPRHQNFNTDKFNSSITFVGGSSVVDHPGKFENFEIAFVPDASDPENLEKGTIAVSIDITSVKTDSTGLDGHLMREDFFDAAIYPEATFQSTIIHKISENEYSITGNLNLKGIAKSITFNAILAENMVFAKYNLPRQEFGIGNDSYGNKLLDPLVPVKVNIMFEK